MDNEVIIDLLKHQIHEMDQDIKSYLEQLDKQENEIKQMKDALSKIYSFTYPCENDFERHVNHLAKEGLYE